MADAAYFQNDSGAVPRYLTVRNDGGSAFTYHSERFNTRATHIQCCPGQPRGNFIAGFFTVKSPVNRVRGATVSGSGNMQANLSIFSLAGSSPVLMPPLLSICSIASQT